MTKHVGDLPAEVSSFVGRREERAEIKRLLAMSRLVTVTGVGGVGKTRTALRVAAEVGKQFPDGVWLVELGALRAGELLAEVVADGCGSCASGAVNSGSAPTSTTSRRSRNWAATTWTRR